MISGERRVDPRMSCLALVDFGYKGKFQRGIIKNLSFGGAYVETPGSFDVGDKLVMTFEDPFFGKNIKTAGQIVWSEQPGFGLKFISN